MRSRDALQTYFLMRKVKTKRPDMYALESMQ